MKREPVHPHPMKPNPKPPHIPLTRLIGLHFQLGAHPCHALLTIALATCPTALVSLRLCQFLLFNLPFPACNTHQPSSVSLGTSFESICAFADISVCCRHIFSPALSLVARIRVIEQVHATCVWVSPLLGDLCVVHLGQGRQAREGACTFMEV